MQTLLILRLAEGSFFEVIGGGQFKVFLNKFQLKTGYHQE